MALDRGGAGDKRRRPVTPRKKREQIRQRRRTPRGPGRVRNLKQFGDILQRQQKGEGVTWNDLRYLQRLAWSTKDEKNSIQFNRAVQTARNYITALGDHRRVVMKDAAGQPIKVGAFGMKYKQFHEDGTVENNEAYRLYLDSFQAQGRQILMGFFDQNSEVRADNPTKLTPIAAVANARQNQFFTDRADLAAGQMDLPDAKLPGPAQGKQQGPGADAAQLATTPEAAPQDFGTAPRLSELPLSIDDQTGKDIVQAHYEVEGTIPGPQKLDDLLRAALSWKDLDPSGKTQGKDAWKSFFTALHDQPAPVAAPFEEDIVLPSQEAKLMFTENKMPEDAAKQPYYMSSGRGGLVRVQPKQRDPNQQTLAQKIDKYIGDVHQVERSYIPKDIDSINGLTGIARRNVEKALIERGFTNETGVMAYANLVDQFVYSANLPFAAWSKDPEVKGNAMWAMGKTSLVSQKDGSGQPVNVNVLASAMGGRNTEQFKEYVYNLGRAGRPPNVSEANYSFWYARQFGSDKLPFDLQPGVDLQADGKAINGPWEATTDLGKAALKWLGIAEPIAGKVSAYVGATKTVGRGFKAADTAMSKNRIVGEYFWNPTKGGVTGLTQGTMKAANYPIEIVNRVIVARAYMAMAQMDPEYKSGDKIGWVRGILMNLGVADFLAIQGVFTNGWDSTVENASKAWRDSDKRRIWHETMRATGVDPVQHENIAFWGQMAVDTGIGIVLDKGLGSAVKFAGSTKTADAILDAWNVQSHNEILASMTSKHAIQEFYGVGDEAAKALAAEGLPERIGTLIENHPAMKAEFDPTLNFNARSISQNLRIRALSNTKIAPAARFILSPLPGDVYTTVQDTNMQVAATLRILGLPEVDVLKICDEIIDERLKTADFPAQAVHNYLSHEATGIDAIVERHLGQQSASARFIRKSGNPKATKLDEFNAFSKRFRGSVDDVDRPTPRRAYAAGDDMNQTGYVENSVALATEHGRRLHKESVRLTRRQGRLERFIDKLNKTRTNVTQDGLDLINEPLPKNPVRETFRGQVYRTDARVRKIAADNGIVVTGKMTQADVVAQLRILRTRAAQEGRRVKALEDGLNVVKAKHSNTIAELNAVDPLRTGVPTAANESHFTNVFVPKYSPTELAIFRGGKAMQEWAIFQRVAHMDAFNNAYKRMWLSRIGSMIGMVAFDEGMRSTLTGINPLGGLPGLRRVPFFEGSYTERAAVAVASDPAFRVHIESDVLNMPHLNSYDVVGPNSEMRREWERGARYVVNTLGKENNLATQVWLDAYDAALSKLNTDHAVKFASDPAHVIPPEEALRQEAMDAADTIFGERIRNDVRFVGGVDPATGKRYIGILPQRDALAYDKSLLAQGLDNEPWVKHYETNTINGLRLFMSHDATEQMLRTGKVAHGDFANTTVRSLIGPVQYRVLKTTGKSRITHAPVAFSDGVFNILSGMATHLKKQNFGYFFEKRMKALEKIAGLSDEQRTAIAKRWALSKTDELSYLSGRTLLEENVRNITLFLPAYRQFWEWWGKRMITKPFSTSKIMEAMSAIQPHQIPQGVPVFGGVEWDQESVNFFSGFTQEKGDRGGTWLPPLAPTITVPWGTAALAGNETALKVYKGMNNGFEPGGPEVRWVDSLLTGAFSMATGRNFDPLYEMTKPLLGERMTGTRYLVEKRDKIVSANLVMLAAATGGNPELLAKLSAKQAVTMMAKQEVGKGIAQFFLPGTWRTTRASFYVMEDGKKLKIDMVRIAQAQSAYLNAISDAQRAEVLKQFPEYAPIAKAWTYEGNRQLAYLANHRWVVPFVSRKNAYKEEFRGIDPADATEFDEQTTPLSPEDILGAIKDRYAEVDKFVLARDYANLSEDWKEAFLAKGRKEGWKVSEQAWKTYTSEDWDKWMEFIEPKQQEFYSAHKKDIDRLLGEGHSMQDKYDVKALPGQSDVPVKYLIWPDKLAIIAADGVTGETFDGMRRLEMSGNPEMVKFVQSSPHYKEYLVSLEKEQRTTAKNFAYKASAPYKSSIEPNEWVTLFGKKWKPGTTDRLLGFLKDVDADRKILSEMYKRGKFGSDEYKKVYYHLQDYITKARKSAPGLAEYIGATTPDLLAMGPNAVNTPHFVGPQSKQALKAFDEATPRILKGGWNPKEMLAIKHEYPELESNWDEAVSRWAWNYTLDAARIGRQQLAATDNPYGWYKGWTVDSKYGTAMQKWLKYNIGLVKRSGYAPKWVEEWDRADAASGGNLISDLLNLQR